MPKPRSLVLASVAAGVACGGAPKPDPIVRPPPLVITAPPPPVRAHWVFSHPERGLTAKLELGDGTTLYVGQNGRRELLKGETMTDAQTLAMDDLVGVMRDDKKQIVFVADDGDVYVAADPLGSLDNVRPGPLTDPKPGATKLVSPSTGKAAIVGITPDRKLTRTADYGNSWKTVDYAANKPYGKAVSVALDEKGNGLLLHLPQRLFVTHDDGATWTPIASPGIGARRVFRDGAGRIFLEGYGGARAKLDGQTLATTTDQPEAIYKPLPAIAKSKPADPSPNVRTESTTILTGDRVVELTQIERHGKPREIEIASHKLGEKIDEKAKPITNTDLLGKEGLSKNIAAWGSEIVYLREDDDADAESPTTTVFRSKDYGATWAKESTLTGSRIAYDAGEEVAVGPKGWTYVAPLCAREENDGDEEEEPTSSDCSKRQIRPAGGAGFEDMAFVEEFTPHAFAFDEAHDKVYALGDNKDGKTSIYESPLSQNKFSRMKLDVSSGSSHAITVDKQGTLRVMAYDYSKKAWRLQRHGADGKDQPDMWIPLDRGELSFIGGRGILFAGHPKGYETNDGGETWIRIATNGFARELKCTEAGCVNGDAQRVGWDLPAVTQATEKVVAQADPPAQTKPSNPPTTNNPPLAPVEISCKPTGAATPITFVPGTDLLDGKSPDMRWASIKNESDGRTTMVVGTKNAVKTMPLLAAEPKPTPGAKVEHRQGQRTLTDGVVTARYSFAPSNGGGYNPVDVDLTWWSSVTGKTQHKLLPKVKPFRVSRYGFSGIPQIVDGGVLFQPQYGEPAFFVHDDGKVETLATPPSSSIQNAERVGKRWLVTDWDGWTARTNVSDDDGKTWKAKAWGLDEYGSVTLTSIGGKATLNLTHSGNPALLFGLDATLPDDPPAPIVVETSSTDIACDATAGRQKFVNYIPYDRRNVKVKIEESNKTTTQLTATTKITHDLPNGKTCTSAYALSGSQTAFVYPEAKGYTGWRFRKNDNPKEKQSTWFAEQLTCQ